MTKAKFIRIRREQLFLAPDAFKKGHVWPLFPGSADTACENCGADLSEVGEVVERGKVVQCGNCGESYDVEIDTIVTPLDGPASIPRAFVVMQLRTMGPSNKIRGEFLGEVIDGDESKVRVWNKKQRHWTNRFVELNEETEVASWRGATYSDLLKFGFKLPNGFHLV